jgi:hypothetical protein
MPDMNGTEPKIEIFKPFGEAFELMKIILFQPFDLKRWLVIGFAAWLASLGAGGGGSFNYGPNGGENMRKVNAAISQIPQPILVLGISLLIIFVLVLVVLFAWLRARGGFMFIDCIVRNRGAIAEPWREFQKEGNSYFLFLLVIGLGLLIFAGLLSLPLVLPTIKTHAFLRHYNLYLISALAGWICVMVLLILAWSLIASFIAPIMYRRHCSAWKGFTMVIKLIAAHPGEMVLYCLFWIVLALATAMVACFAACATCCIAVIPYVGTVILLPIFVLLRTFSLLFLRQFGPDYDVWASFTPREFLPILSPSPPVPATSVPLSNSPPEPPPQRSL